MVEFALVGPLLLLLLFLVIESALYVNALATMDNAVREGARIAAICGSSDAPFRLNHKTYSSCSAAVDGTVTDHLGFLPVTAGSTSCSNPCVTTTQPQPDGSVVNVSATYTYQYYLNLFIGTGPTTNITSQATVVSQR